MPPFPKPARQWTSFEIAADCKEAADKFRARRLAGPLTDYLSAFPTTAKAAGHIIANLSHILATPADQELLANIVGDTNTFEALRYLAVVPISKDDLNTLLGSNLSATALRKNPTLANELVNLLTMSLDPRRFPWIASGKPPSAAQLGAAKLASAVAATISRVQTKRRSDERKALENEIADLLKVMGWKKVPTPRTPIALLSHDGPKPGEYMQHCTLGKDNIDFVIGLKRERGRVLALEAKASNSAINSRKRFNKEVGGNAQNMQTSFGEQVIAAAALRGVFKPGYIESVQVTPVVIFWAHRFDDLRAFLNEA